MFYVYIWYVYIYVGVYVVCGCMDAVFKEKVALKNLGGNNENKGWKESKKKSNELMDGDYV